jgi:1-acyl-sn-glycerol-3-phosphate acyltransferase
MLAPPVALAWAFAYTIDMSRRAMVAKALGGGDDRVREMTKAWAVGLGERMGIEVRGRGLDRIDWCAPSVLMANHQSYLDVMALYRVLPQCFGFVAKQGLYVLPFFAGVMRALGCVPIDRKSRADALASMRRAAQIVAGGSTIALFPEGTRSRGDRILPMKKGPFHLVQLAQVPSVPIGIRGAAELMPRSNTGIRPGVIEVHVGEALPPPPPGDAEARLALMHQVRQQLALLAEQPMVDADD